jgi:hypothetical protein
VNKVKLEVPDYFHGASCLQRLGSCPRELLNSQNPTSRTRSGSVGGWFVLLTAIAGKSNCRHTLATMPPRVRITSAPVAMRPGAPTHSDTTSTHPSFSGWSERMITDVSGEESMPVGTSYSPSTRALTS